MSACCLGLRPEPREAVQRSTKKKVTDPCVYLVNFRGTNQPQNIMFLDLFLVRFWAFLGEGSSKTRFKKMQKVHVNFFFCEGSQKIDKNFDVTFSSIFFGFYRVFRCFLAMGFHKHYKKRFIKKSCRKFFSIFFSKTIKKISQTDFFSICFYHVFGRFSVREFKNTTKNLGKKSDQPWYFFGLRGTNHPRRGP
jgi:hypothetical protein